MNSHPPSTELKAHMIDQAFVERLKADPANVANQLRALTQITDWARVQHRQNFDAYLVAAADLLRTPSIEPSVEKVESEFRIRVWNALRKEASIGDDACYRVINAAWKDFAPVFASIEDEGGHP